MTRNRDRSREFDIVLWGATGFTGQLVADYLAKNYLGGETGLRLALAGRNEDKVRKVAADIGQPDLPILVGDSFDTASLDAMASRAEVIISTVGPYAKYGAELGQSAFSHWLLRGRSVRLAGHQGEGEREPRPGRVSPHASPLPGAARAHEGFHARPLPAGALGAWHASC